MQESGSGCFVLALLVFAAMFVVGNWDDLGDRASGAARGWSEPRASVSYSPPLPITLSIDTHGNVGVRVGAKVKTPIGDFGFSAFSSRSAKTKTRKVIRQRLLEFRETLSALTDDQQNRIGALFRGASTKFPGDRFLIVLVDGRPFLYPIGQRQSKLPNIESDERYWKIRALRLSRFGDVVLHLESVPSISVSNFLVLPVRLLVNHAFWDVLEPGEQRTIVLPSYPARVGWEVVKKQTTSGREVGDRLVGYREKVRPGAKITITHRSGSKEYFFPVVTNLTPDDCTVVINKGWKIENRIGAVVPAHAENIGLGYFYLDDLSNVTLVCESEWWWGVRPGGLGGRSLRKGVNQLSGIYRMRHTGS